MNGMAFHPERQALDQRRAAALTRLLDRALGFAVDGEHVRTVDDDAVEAVCLRPVGDRLARELEVSRRRIRPLVVVADEDHRESSDSGHVHALVRVAARGGALSEPADRDPLLFADPEGERRSHRDREHRRQVAHHRDQAEPVVGHVDVSVPAARGAVDPAHELREHAPGLDAADDVDAHVAVQRGTDVLRAHCRGYADGGRFVPAAGVEAARDLPLLVEDVAPLLDSAGEDEVAVDAEEVLAVETGFLGLLDRADWLCFARNRHVAVVVPLLSAS